MTDAPGAHPGPAAALMGMSARQLRGVVAAIAAVSIFAFGLSLSLPLISINLERMGASGLVIGLNGAASAVAILASGFVMPPLLRHFSAPLLMTVGAVSMCLILPIFPLFPDPWIWMGLRFLFGIMVTALFFCSELWIVAASPPGKRGLVIGVYGVFLSLGFLAGPALLSVIGTEGKEPFLLGAAFALLALPPIVFAWRAAPDPGEATESAGAVRDVLNFFRTDPAILWAVALFGMIEFGAMGLMPVWAIRVGQEEAAALILVALIAAGNVVMQVPMGWIGDRLDRRRLLGFCAFVCLSAAALFPLLSATVWPLWIMAAVWGGLVVGLYTFSLNELGHRYSGQMLARATGAVMSAYGLGSLVAPPLLGWAMDAAPPHGMFWVVAAGSAAYIGLLSLRRRRTA